MEQADQKAHLSLRPKPCRTCGRIITPRQKWARNWNEIRFCSDSCRTWQSVVPYYQRRELEGPNDAQTQHSREGEAEQEPLCLQGHFKGFFEKRPGHHPGSDIFHIDAWLEALLLATPTTNADGRKSLEDIDKAIDRQLTDGPEQQTSFCSKILERKPGRREILRRSARRLAILAYDDLALAAFARNRNKVVDEHFRSRAGSFSLWQGKKRLLTLEDVSFAKGTIEVCTQGRD